MGLPSSPTKIGSSRFCVISLTYIGSINLCVLCVFVVRSRLSLGGMYLRIHLLISQVKQQPNPTTKTHESTIHTTPPR
ncbi:MAG: hypothetical protein EWV88_13815 [Microcystis wesenbergii Mw_MB_S_20031200_S109D]|uniref:Uncharacterized protein n=1 Tax=Microcystis wesenbergii Mw_MB_S_20031200_S109D TaxID=2486241 RepID=A0A552LQ09_9CHRO|nr:MAG: hypothetical protein EWV88_13815 [Microcystis wesenbergii Mw_MB_S_20031200_S109D]